MAAAPLIAPSCPPWSFLRQHSTYCCWTSTGARSAGSAATSWRDVIAASLAADSRWLALEQGRADDGLPCPLPNDITLTRAVRRRLRPLGIGLADHVIRHRTASFSFRANGLL